MLRSVLGYASVYVNNAGQLIYSSLERTSTAATTITDSEAEFSGTIIGSGSGNALSVKDKVTSDITLKNTTLDGNFNIGEQANVVIQTSGNTTITGEIKGYASSVKFTVEEGVTTVNGNFKAGSSADEITISSNAALNAGAINAGNGDDAVTISEGAELTVTNTFDLGNGNDEVVIAANADVTVGGKISLGNGDNTLVVGEGASVSVAGEISAGHSANDALVMGKGSSIDCADVTMVENLTIDVDAILECRDQVTDFSIKVNGVASLTEDIAGASVVISKVGGMTGSAASIDNVDVILNTTPYQSSGIYKGEVAQVAGVGTAETTDDVWASLNKIDGSLVVAWGRSETEVGAALDAFISDDTLALGESIVASATTLDDSDSTNDFNKKTNGTLA